MSVEILLLIVGGIIGVAADEIWKQVNRYVRNARPAGVLWGWVKEGGSPTRIVISTCPTDDPSEYTDTIYPQEARAASEVESYLKSALSAEVRLLLSARVGGAINNNLIVIGGPNHNHVTRRVVPQPSLPFSFDGYALVNS
jgi:hypothetical protein